MLETEQIDSADQRRCGYLARTAWSLLQCTESWPASGGADHQPASARCRQAVESLKAGAEWFFDAITAGDGPLSSHRSPVSENPSLRTKSETFRPLLAFRQYNGIIGQSPPNAAAVCDQESEIARQTVRCLGSEARAGSRARNVVARALARAKSARKVKPIHDGSQDCGAREPRGNWWERNVISADSGQRVQPGRAELQRERPVPAGPMGRQPCCWTNWRNCRWLAAKCAALMWAEWPEYSAVGSDHEIR